MVLFSHAQKCEVVQSDKLGIMYPATQINLSSDHFLDLSKLNRRISSENNFSSMDSTFGAYISHSDSTIMLFVTKDAVSFFKICSSKAVCDSLAHNLYIENLIIEEFIRLQNAGVFQGTTAEADSLIHYIVQKIKSVYGGTLPSEISFSNAVYTTFNPPISGDGAGFTNPVSSLCFYNRNGIDLNFCDLIDSVRQCGANFRQETPTILNSMRRAVPPGMKYRAFDMNGNFIRGGVWREEYSNVFRTPAVVQFDNGVTVRYFRTKEHWIK